MSQTRMSTRNFLGNLDQYEPELYPSLAGPVFEEMGFRYTDEIKEELRSDDSLLPELYDKLQESGVRPVQLNKIKRAINSLLNDQTREADTETRSQAEAEPEQEQMNDTQIRSKMRIKAKELITNICDKKRKLITLEEIYERVGAETNLEKNGVQYGVWEAKNEQNVRSTSERGTYEVC